MVVLKKSYLNFIRSEAKILTNFDRSFSQKFAQFLQDDWPIKQFMSNYLPTHTYKSLLVVLWHSYSPLPQIFNSK